MGSDQSKFFSIFRREVRRTVQKLEEVLSESRSVCPDLSVSSWFPLSLKIVSQWEAGLSGGFKETPYSLDREDSERRDHGLWMSDTRWCNVAVTRRTVGCRAVLTLSPKSGLGSRYLKLDHGGRPKSRLQVEAARSLNNIRTAGVDFHAFCKRPSRSASGPWCWVGRSVMFLFDCWLAGWLIHLQPLVWVVRRSCSCLIIGWWVDLCLGRFGGVTEVVSEHGFVHASGTNDLIGMKTLKWREFEAKPKPEAKEERQFQRDWTVVWTGKMGGNKTSLGKDFIKSWEDEDRENGWSNQERAWTR
ncbi:hypothetical protein YC2023_072239 [Brassica napus]